MKLTFVRRLSQGFFLVLFIYILWSTTYPLTGFLPPGTFFKTDPLLMIATAVSERFWLKGLELALAMIFLTLLVGRFFCGWVCPLGAVTDFLRSFLCTTRQVSDPANARLRRVKFVPLALIAVLALAGFQYAWALDPVTLIGRFVSLNLIPTATLLTDAAFIGLIKLFGRFDPLYDFYRFLQGALLGVKVHYFESSLPIFVFFTAVCSLTFLLRRLWCRMLCPLGAVYALASKSSLLKRAVDEKCIRCGLCRSDCRMGAIREDFGTVKGECILCMDCVYDCPSGAVRFVWAAARKPKPQGGGVSRREFLFLAFSSLMALGAELGRKTGFARSRRGGLIRPPGSLGEDAFRDRCIRCGNCMKVCPTNALQPAAWESGASGVWTPKLVPEIGWCEYNCNLCGQVCPTGAIRRLGLEKKQRAVMGTAVIHRSICLAWGEERQCIVCEEHCPVPTKAIRLIRDAPRGSTLYKPYVVKDLCIGCGICQNKCPVRPIRAIRVEPSPG